MLFPVRCHALLLCTSISNLLIHLGSFHDFAINEAAMDIPGHVFWRTCALTALGDRSGSGMAGP